MADYNFKIIYCSETANVVADALTRKHSKLVTQKEKNITVQTQLFLNPSCIIAAIGEGSTNVKSGSLNVSGLCRASHADMVMKGH